MESTYLVLQRWILRKVWFLYISVTPLYSCQQSFAHTQITFVNFIGFCRWFPTYMGLSLSTNSPLGVKLVWMGHSSRLEYHEQRGHQHGMTPKPQVTESQDLMGTEKIQQIGTASGGSSGGFLLLTCFNFSCCFFEGVAILLYYTSQQKKERHLFVYCHILPHFPKHESCGCIGHQNTIMSMTAMNHLKFPAML